MSVSGIVDCTDQEQIGAGIQLPVRLLHGIEVCYVVSYILMQPNPSRIMSDWNLMDKLYEAGCGTRDSTFGLRWSDGSVLFERPGREWAVAKFGHPWQ